MPRYVVERTFPEGLNIPMIDRITEVRELNPYFYTPSA